MISYSQLKHVGELALPTQQNSWTMDFKPLTSVASGKKQKSKI